MPDVSFICHNKQHSFEMKVAPQQESLDEGKYIFLIFKETEMKAKTYLDLNTGESRTHSTQATSYKNTPSLCNSDMCVCLCVCVCAHVHVYVYV